MSTLDYSERRPFRQGYAGTGKTWLLVARILRLLLAGAEPDSILAITFTRKAAAEIQQCLTEWLEKWLVLDDQALAEDLKKIRRISNLFLIIFGPDS